MLPDLGGLRRVWGTKQSQPYTYCLNYIVWCVIDISLLSANSWCTSGEIHGHTAKWSLSLPHRNHTYTLHTWTGSGVGRETGNEGKNVKDRVRGRRGKGGWEKDDLIKESHTCTSLLCCLTAAPWWTPCSTKLSHWKRVDHWNQKQRTQWQ